MSTHNPMPLWDLLDSKGSIDYYPDSDYDERTQPEIKVRTFFNGKVVKNWFVIVETWDHKRYGKGKREYLKEFTEKERAIIGRYHTLLYNWYLRTGTPREVCMSFATYNLMNQAANFFATI